MSGAIRTRVLLGGVLLVVLLSGVFDYRHRQLRRAATAEQIRLDSRAVVAEKFNARLLALLVNEQLPELASLKDDWERVNLVRDWAYSRIPLQLPPLDRHNTLSHCASLLEGTEGARCGGTSYALQQIYGALGYEAHIYSVGVPGAHATHALTLVRIKRDGRFVTTIQDAYFNMTVTDSEGNPVDFSGIMEGLADGRGDSLVFQRGERRLKPVILGEGRSIHPVKLVTTEEGRSAADLFEYREEHRGFERLVEEKLGLADAPAYVLLFPLEAPAQCCEKVETDFADLAREAHAKLRARLKGN